MRGFLTLGWLSLVLALSTPAAATDPDDEARATALFKEGRAAMTAEDFETACARFAESQRLLPARGTLLNLAVCREKQGALAAALEAFEEVLLELPENDERRAFALEQAEGLRARVPVVTLARSDDLSASARITREGVELPLDEPLRLDPGDHVIVVEMAGHQKRRYRLRLEEGEQETLTLEPGPSELPDGGADEEADDGLSPLVVAGVTASVLGGAALAVGAVTGGLAIDKKGVVDRDCGPATCTTQEGVDAAAEGATLASVSTATFIIGGAAIATGVILIVLGLDEEPGEGVAVTPLVGPESAFLGISGRF